MTIHSGYDYEIMKEVGLDKKNNKLLERALWWKTYSGDIIDEIRNLRSRFSAGMKKVISNVSCYFVLNVFYIVNLV